MDVVKWNEFFGGYLAFRCGKALRTISRKIKVFRTEEAAWAALKKSKALYGW